MSNGGRHGLTIIGFIGSVFSPYYAWSGRKAPVNHCAINVALYGARSGRWTMTERGESALVRDRTALSIGPSAFWWSGSELRIDIDEIAAPFPRRVKGTVRVIPEVVTKRCFVLDEEGRHAWWPIAPRARVEVDLKEPGLSWQGAAYLDTNAGVEPLEAGFVKWDWSRANLETGAAVLYDVTRKTGDRMTLGLRFDRNGDVEEMEAPPAVRLPSAPIWRVARGTHAEGGDAKVLRTLEDSPFYARSILKTRILGEDATAMHESLDLRRFDTRWVKMLLPFRMPRAWWSA